MKYTFVILNVFFVVLLNTSVNGRTFLQLENRSLTVPLAASNGKECTVPGILCDCDDPKNVYVCIRSGNDFIKQHVDTCGQDYTCITNEGGCSNKPNLQCEMVSFQMECKSDGIFPDPYNCKKYHICVPEIKYTHAKTTTTTTEESVITTTSPGGDEEIEYKAYSLECDEGYGYDPSTTFCQVELKNNECESSLIPVCTTFTLPKSFTTNPSYYYMCAINDGDDNYQPKIFRCPHGEPFINGTCATKEAAQVDCKNNGRLTDPADCTAYFECRNGEAIHYKCKTGYSFNVRKLKCEKGNYVLVWRKGSTLISAGNVMVTLDQRFRLLGYQLQIREVDAKDAGDYVCQIGDGTPGDQIHTIEILVPPSVTMSPANGHMTARKGGSVTFECKATGNPTPRIEWSKKNGLLPTGEQSVSGSTLTVTSIERKDAGTYQCTASNGVGQAVFATVQLHVLYPPEVSTDRNWIRSDGVEAQLSCIVHADPQAEVHWYQDSFHLEPTDRRTMETRGNTHTLIIRHLQNSDFGNYSCLVENSLGRTKKYIELTGKPGPVNFLGAPFSKWPNSYNVSWRVDSLPPLQEIRLLYRKLQVNETYQQPGKWHDIILTPPATETLNHEMSYNIRDLEPSSVFEVMIQAKNRFGWSELSQLHQFYTRGLNEINSNEIEDMGLFSSLSSPTFLLNKNLMFFIIISQIIRITLFQNTRHIFI